MKTLQTGLVSTSRDVAPHTRNTRDSLASRPSTSPLASSFSSVSRHRRGIEIAYYGHPEAERLLVEGIPLEDDCAGCPEHHICLGWSPELSANFGPVLEVDVAGLPVVWEKGEGRIHESISADRVLRLFPAPSCRAGTAGKTLRFASTTRRASHCLRARPSRPLTRRRSHPVSSDPHRVSDDALLCASGVVTTLGFAAGVVAARGAVHPQVRVDGLAPAYGLAWPTVAGSWRTTDRRRDVDGVRAARLPDGPGGRDDQAAAVRRLAGLARAGMGRMAELLAAVRIEVTR